VLAKVTFDMSKKDPALQEMKAVADYYSLHRNPRLDFINGKPKKAVENLVSVLKPATLKALIVSRLEMNKSDLQGVGLPRVRCVPGKDGYHPRRAPPCCGT
jgi:hypothetical protein